MAKETNEMLLKRYEMIAPLLNENIDNFERRRWRAQILVSSGISARSLRRYMQTYKEKGTRVFRMLIVRTKASRKNAD